MDKNEVMHRPRHPAVRINHFTSYFSLKIGKNLIIWFPHGIRASGGGRWKDGRQVTSGYSSSDWWLLTDPCDCDWQALTTTPLALASAHCWAQQVVWRLAEIPNKMDITGKNNSRPRGGECWARSAPPSHSVPGFTNSAPFQDCGIHSHSQANLLLSKLWFSHICSLVDQGVNQTGEREREGITVRMCGAACFQTLHLILFNKAEKSIAIFSKCSC